MMLSPDGRLVAVRKAYLKENTPTLDTPGAQVAIAVIDLAMLAVRHPPSVASDRLRTTVF
jgi:hypothetical protein